MGIRIQWGALSDRGQVRLRNEDNHVVWVADDPKLPLQAFFAVADGMGGHPGGADASRLATEELKQIFTSMKTPLDSPEDELAVAFHRVHEKIRETGRTTPDLCGMGTTLTALLVTRREIYGAHVGDSRLYEIPAGGSEIILLTKDHTLAQEQADAGIIPNTRLEEHPLSHILTRSVGAGDAPGVDVLKIGRPGPEPRTFIISSDGLIRVVSEQEIPTAVKGKSPEEAVHALVDLANSRGAPDNVTVIFVGIRSEDSPPA
jgi:protein phosphatase